MQEDQASSTVSFCPSFSAYSSNNQLADIASNVAKEKEDDHDDYNNNIFSLRRNQNDGAEAASNSSSDDEDENDDEFEFVLVRANQDGSNETTSFPIFPVFNRDLLLDDDNSNSINNDERDDVIRLPLKKLFIDDGDQPSSTSSSEADELEGISPGTYCVWTPSKPSPSSSPSPSRCKKSNSTGSSSKQEGQQQQRWRLRDLLHLKRSNSEGKQSFIFLNTDHSHSHSQGKKLEKERKTVAGKAKEKAASAHEVFYVRNKALKDSDKRKSYLPYRQGLVGFFANVHGF